MPILAITREIGSLGTFIGREVARRLGYSLVRQEVITEAARMYEAAEENLIATVEAKPDVWDSLSEGARRHFAFIAAEVFDFALRDNVVIVGRWSTLLLRGIAHAVRVRVCAPMDLRVRRAAERLGIGLEEARMEVLRSDRGIRARIQQFFDVEWADPILYEVTINTEQFTVETGADLLCHLLARPERQASAASSAVLHEGALAARVRAALKATPETSHLSVDIHCRGGRVVLAGTVGSEAGRDAASRVAAAQAGVEAVENRLLPMKIPIR